MAQLPFSRAQLWQQDISNMKWFLMVSPVVTIPVQLSLFTDPFCSSTLPDNVIVISNLDIFKDC